MFTAESENEIFLTLLFSNNSLGNKKLEIRATVTNSFVIGSCE